MPVYTGLTYPYTICNNLDKKKLYKFIKIFLKVKDTYNIDNAFVNSLKVNMELEESYIATYDISKTNISVYKYQTNIKEIIDKCNAELSKNKSFNKYKFDITGSPDWTMGKIIIMEKK